MTGHRVRISEGNIKLGRVASVSLLPIIACALGIPCALDCYAVAMLRGRYGKNIRKSWAANLDFARQDLPGYFRQIARWITRKQPPLFRFHIAGDYLNADYFAGALAVARSFPDTGFLAFTKRFDLLPHPRGIPQNYAIIASLWPGWGKRPAGYRAAFMSDPKNPDNRIPANALRCAGGCDSCALCWSLRKLRRDVFFPKH